MRIFSNRIKKFILLKSWNHLKQPSEWTIHLNESGFPTLVQNIHNGDKHKMLSHIIENHLKYIYSL